MTGTPSPLGFIGCGHMGGAMAERLLISGFALVICDPDDKRLLPLTDRGAVAVATPREVADRAQIVFACLPSPEISKKVATGTEGVAGGSTVSSSLRKSIAVPSACSAIIPALGTKPVMWFTSTPLIDTLLLFQLLT